MIAKSISIIVMFYLLCTFKYMNCIASWFWRILRQSRPLQIWWKSGSNPAVCTRSQFPVKFYLEVKWLNLLWSSSRNSYERCWRVRSWCWSERLPYSSVWTLFKFPHFLKLDWRCDELYKDTWSHLRLYLIIRAILNLVCTL